MVTIMELEDLPTPLFRKLGLVQCPVILIGPQYFTHHLNMSFATILLNETSKILAKVFHHNDTKDITILDNGCIRELSKIKTVQFTDMLNMYTPKAITFNLENMKNSDNSFLEDINDFRRLLVSRLRIGIYLYENSVVRVHFKTQLWFLRVKQIHHFEGRMIPSPYGVYLKDDTPINFTMEDTKRILNFSHFGGFRCQIDQLRSLIDSAFSENPPEKMIGVLLSGDTLSGKTYIGDILASIYQEKFICRNPQSVRRKEDLGTVIINDFKNAVERSPCIIFLDRIDNYCQDRNENRNVQLVNTLLNLLDGTESANLKGIVVIGTAKQPDKLDPALRRSGRLDIDIHFPLPSAEERVEIVKILLRNENISNDEKIDVANCIGKKANGYNAGDIHAVLTSMLTTRDDPISVSRLNIALDTIKPKGLKDIQTTDRKIDLADIVGNEEIKSNVITTIKKSIRFRDFILRAGLVPTTKFLFFGPSGCGKSMLVHAISKEFNFAVIPVRRSNVFGKYFGESEKNLEEIFKTAIKSSPCIIHFEHFDAFVSKGAKSGHSTVENRLISHLKILLDGINSLESVIIIAETNRPDLLEESTIRNGRFQRYIYFPLPSETDRKLIINKIIPDLTKDNWNEILKNTEGFSMSQVRQLCEDVERRIRYGEEDSEKIINEIINLNEVKNASDKMKKMFISFSKRYN